MMTIVIRPDRADAAPVFQCVTAAPESAAAVLDHVYLFEVPDPGIYALSVTMGGLDAAPLTDCPIHDSIVAELAELVREPYTFPASPGPGYDCC